MIDFLTEICSYYDCFICSYIGAFGGENYIREIFVLSKSKAPTLIGGYQTTFAQYQDLVIYCPLGMADKYNSWKAGGATIKENPLKITFDLSAREQKKSFTSKKEFQDIKQSISSEIDKNRLEIAALKKSIVWIAEERGFIDAFWGKEENGGRANYISLILPNEYRELSNNVKLYYTVTPLPNNKCCMLMGEIRALEDWNSLGISFNNYPIVSATASYFLDEENNADGDSFDHPITIYINKKDHPEYEDEPDDINNGTVISFVAGEGSYFAKNTGVFFNIILKITD